MARNTVADAYAEVVAEGWLTARQGSGTRVADRTPSAPGRPAREPAGRPAGSTTPPPAYDLRQGLPHTGSFPVRPGSPPPAGPSPRRPTTPSGPAIRAAGSRSSRAARSPSTWPGCAGCAPRRRRRDLLTAALAEHAPHIAATGTAAGLHAVLRLPPGTERSAAKAAVLRLPPGTERSAAKAAAFQNLALDPLADFRHPAAAPTPEEGLVVGYAAAPDHTFAAAPAALCRALPPP